MKRTRKTSLTLDEGSLLLFYIFFIVYTLAATVEGSPECLCAAFNKPIWNEQPLQ